jgi:hypothetical protein
MDILKGNEVWEEIVKKYNKKPSLWHTLEYKSPSGFYDLLIFNPENTYLLKKDTVYKPSPLVIGMRLDETEYHKTILKGDNKTIAQVIRSPTYGFRQISIKPIMKRIERFVDEGRNPAMIFNSFVKMMLKARERAKHTQPVPTHKLETMEIETYTEDDETVRMDIRHALIGPYIPVGLEAISKNHRQLSARLDEELRRLLHREYPMYV